MAGSVGGLVMEEEMMGRGVVPQEPFLQAASE